MKKLIPLLLLIPLALSSCTSSSTSKGISIDNYELARISPDQQIIPIPDGVFHPGEEVSMILYNVGKFKKGEDGLCELDMDMEVLNSEGQTVFSASELLGEGGHLLLDNGYAGTPNATFSTTENTPTGDYTMKVRIYDQVGKGSATVSMKFSLQ